MKDFFDLSISPTVLLVRLGCATVLGILLAWRPCSRRKVRLDVKHALIIMTVAAAMVVTVIGDNLARAFGVVGLGSFIRFRSSLKDTRDVVLFFVAIGTGMACGLGVVVIAAVGLGVIWVILLVLDLLTPKEPEAAAPPSPPAAPPVEPR